MGKGRLGLVLVIGLAAAITVAFAATKAPDKSIVIESKTVFAKLTAAQLLLAVLVAIQITTMAEEEQPLLCAL